jgi:hypothetical protein
MSETEDFKPEISHKTASFPPSSRATSSVPSIIPGSSENPISISDSDSDGEDFIPLSRKELAERRSLKLNFLVKKEPKGDVLKSVPVKREYYSFKFFVVSNFIIFIISGSRSVSPEIKFLESAASLSFKRSRKGKEKNRHSVVKITSRLSVDRLDVITSLPSTWAVPRDRSATLVDLSGCEIPSRRSGEEYTIDGFIRAEVCI